MLCLPLKFRVGRDTSILVSDTCSPEASALNNASIVGERLAGCGFHAMEVIKACHRNGPPFYLCNVNKT